MIKQAEETVDAFIGQKQELVKTLEQRVRDLTAEIEVREARVEELSKIVTAAFREKETAVLALENVWKDKCGAAEQTESRYNSALRDLETAKIECQKRMDSALAEIDASRRVVASDAAANAELKIRNEETAAELKKRADNFEESLLLAESLEKEASFKAEQAGKRIKEAEIRENNAGIVEERQKNRESRFVEREAALKVREDENAALALIFSNKQEELLDLKKQLDVLALENEKQKQKNVLEAEENLVEKKRNEVEASRIKNLSVELSNREVSITERENLFKPK